jgi:hypothetical protein
MRIALAMMPYRSGLGAAPSPAGVELLFAQERFTARSTGPIHVAARGAGQSAPRVTHALLLVVPGQLVGAPFQSHLALHHGHRKGEGTQVLSQVLVAWLENRLDETALGVAGQLDLVLASQLD